jgi:hypothetical protein
MGVADKYTEKFLFPFNIIILHTHCFILEDIGGDFQKLS